MSDPRLSTDQVGQDALEMRVAIDDSTITYSATSSGGSASVGLAVTYSAAGTISTVADGEFVLGKLICVESDNYATVQYGGAMELAAGTSASLTLGKAIVGDLLIAAEGYIREVNTADADELGVCRGLIHDASDTTAVQVVL